jgi:hypothetical protein
MAEQNAADRLYNAPEAVRIHHVYADRQTYNL